MNENRNMILAIVLSALVLLGWTLLSDKLMPPAPKAKVETKAKPSEAPAAAPAAQPAQKLQTRAQAIAGSPRVQIRTPSLEGSINLKGARFDDLVLLKQRVAIEPTSPPVRLLSPVGAAGAYYASFGWTGQVATWSSGPNHSCFRSSIAFRRISVGGTNRPLSGTSTVLSQSAWAASR